MVNFISGFFVGIIFTGIVVIVSSNKNLKEVIYALFPWR